MFFFEVLSLRPLFPGSNEVDQIAKIHEVLGTPSTNILKKLQNKSRSMNFNFPAKTGTGLRVLLPHDHVSKECIELIELMCTYDPDERITAKQALRHPYFKQLREQDRRQSARLVSPDGSLIQSKPHRVVKKKRKHIIGQNRARSPSQSILPKEGGFKSLTGGIVANQQPSLPPLGIGYKQNTYGTTLPKIPVATTTHTTTFPTSFHSIIQQEKNKVKNQTSQKFGHFTLPAIDNSKRPGDHGL